MSFKLKFNYNGIFRRTSVDTLSYSVVETAARELYSIPATHKVTLTWVDEEQDTITVSSEQEFQEFVQSQSNVPAFGRAYSTPALLKFGVVVDTLKQDPQESTNTRATYVDNSYAPQTIHYHVACDGCGVKPIVGVRYKCTGRENFDLCSDCERKCEQPYPMLKIYEPYVGLRLKVKGHGFKRGFGCRRFARGNSSENESSVPIPNPPPFSGPVVHDGVTCDECKRNPIVGIRYKCTGREDFDLCGECEASKVIQPFPMIKIYRPDISVQVCGWGAQNRSQGFGKCPFGGNRAANGCSRRGVRSDFPACDSSSPFWPRQADITETIATVVNNAAAVATTFMDDVDEQILSQTIQLSMDEAAPITTPAATVAKEANAPTAVPNPEIGNANQQSSTSPSSSFSTGNIRGYALKPMARFVGDITIPDASVIAPSTDFVKIWLVRNDGPCDWPDGVRLVTAGGDPMCDVNLSIPVDSIVVGDETHVSITLKSPPAPGRYMSYFRLIAPDGIVFGQKLWVDIRVKPTGNVLFTSPAFAVPKHTPASDTASGLETKTETPPSAAPSAAPYAVTFATSSATLPFPEPELMEFPTVDDTGHSPTVPAADSVVSGVVDDDARWAAESAEMERDWKVELDALRGMGFHNTRENVRLLKKYTKCSFLRFPQLQGKPFSDSLSTILDALLN